jgi:hypothetical protein
MKRLIAVLIVFYFLFSVTSCATLPKNADLLDENTQKQITDKKRMEELLLTPAGLLGGFAVGVGGAYLSNNHRNMWLIAGITAAIGGAWQYYMTQTRWDDEKHMKDELNKIDKRLYDQWLHDKMVQGRK